MKELISESTQQVFDIKKANGQFIRLNQICRADGLGRYDLSVWDGETRIEGLGLTIDEERSLEDAFVRRSRKGGIKTNGLVETENISELQCGYDELAFENDDIVVVYKGVYKFNGLFAQGYRIRFIIENKTDYPLRIVGKNISANGFVVSTSDLFNSEVDSRKKVIDTVLMGQSNLSSAGIKKVSDMKELKISFEYEMNKIKIRTPEIILEPYEIDE